MIVAYTEELMIKLATLLKIVWVMEFAKVNNRSPSCLEAHLVYKQTQRSDLLMSNAR